MKVKKYLKPEKEADGRGPHKSLCTSSKGIEACQEACLFVKTVPMMFSEYTTGTNTILARYHWKTSHHIVFT